MQDPYIGCIQISRIQERNRQSSQLTDRRETVILLFHANLGAIRRIEMLIKNRIRSYKKRSGGILISEPEPEFQQNNSGGPRLVSIVQQQEIKEDPLVSGENIQIEFTLNVVKESQDFPNGGKGKGG